MNYRCFEDHTVTLKDNTIIVGPNNAGKSTIIEALRLVSIITNRFGALSFREPPDWLELSKKSKGVSPSLKGIEFNFLSVFHRYRNPPAIIAASFDTGATVEILIGPKTEIFAIVRDIDGRPIQNKSKALSFPLPKVSILPQIAPLSQDEVILDADYVRSAISSSWASLHFRNQLNLYPEYYGDFRELTRSTWPGVTIRKLEGNRGNPHDPLALLVQDDDFVAEIAWMGHGLQMWLQTMWFLARSKDSSTIILDEPDVYLHADLQRKLIRLLNGEERQVIVATHSIEIMSEVDAQDILIVNRNASESSYASSLPSVQHVIDVIGGLHNLQLTRLWHSQRCLMVEGEDLTYLKQIQNILFPKSSEPIDTIPNMQLGGWNGWTYAVGSKLLLKNAIGESIVVYCVLDSDYHTPEEIKERLNQAAQRNIELHIWNKKEIENYLVIPEVILRIIESGNREKIIPSIGVVEKALDQILENQKDITFDAISAEFFLRDRASGVAEANRKARNIIEQAWKTRDGKLSIIAGKKVISELSRWTKETYGVTLSPMKIIRNLERSEIDSELRTVVTAIEKGHKM
jgi:hypothetical protein